ncbi:PD-(D/E)XK nuclease-like domain-containing protein [Aliisedimentitalea scapharcae]|uniref:PD-(D/E)XK nuclease-like domain-containing protein n=1 Tax=Aliisedimentitalea scapharcae TaxID=1524259 RepID=A0ABZ2XT71_9RHOB
MFDVSEFEIRVLKPDQIITEPGFYQMPLDRHHSQPCDGPSVTSGVLRKMELDCPAVVWERHLLNPNRTEMKQTDALRFGRIMAAYIEHGPEGVEDHVLVTRSGPPSLPVTEMIQLVEDGHTFTKAPPNRPSAEAVKRYVEGTATPAMAKAVEYHLELEKDPREKISENDWEMICAMGKALANNPDATAAMDGTPEISMAWQDEATGLWCLARPDTVSFSGMTTDYKKMSSMGREFNARLVDSRITIHGYDMQGGFACEGFEQLTGHWPLFGIIAQHDVAPFSAIVREIPDEDLKIGKFRNHRALRRFRECLDSGHWPGPGENIGAYQRPNWQRERLLEEMNNAGEAP